MPPRWILWCGYLFAGLLLASGLAHAGLGWPDLRSQLVRGGLQPAADVLGATGAGWLFGSVCMFTFSAIFAAVTWGLSRGDSSQTPLRITSLIGLAYLIFGIGGCLGRGVSSHFLAFGTLGLLFGLWSRAASGAVRRTTATTASHHPGGSAGSAKR